MNPTDILFSTATQLTGGLVTDLTTAILAMVVIGVIIIGIDYLKDALHDVAEKQRFGSALEEAKRYNSLRNVDDPVMRDYYRAQYKNSIRKASKYGN